MRHPALKTIALFAVALMQGTADLTRRVFELPKGELKLHDAPWACEPKGFGLDPDRLTLFLENPHRPGTAFYVPIESIGTDYAGTTTITDFKGRVWVLRNTRRIASQTGIDWIRGLAAERDVVASA